MGRSAIARVEPNIIDKVITMISPEAGLRRQHARSALALSGGYTGARYDRRETRDWFTRATSADESSIPDLPTLRARSRDLVRNAPIAGGAIANVVKNAVGTGLSAHPHPELAVIGWTDDQANAWAEITFREFEMWAASQDSDIARTQNFYESQALVLRSTLESGDTFALMPMVARPGNVYKTRFQIIEADRVASPNGDGRTVKYGTADKPIESAAVVGGVEREESGAPVAYYITRRHPSTFGFVMANAEWDRYLAFGSNSGRRNVLHIYDRERPDQTRGIPYLAPVMEQLKQITRFGEAELMKAIIQSFFTVFITSEADQSGLTTPSAVTPAGKIADIELGSGIINSLQPGEKVEPAQATTPSAGFDPFFQAIVRQIGIRLQLPYEVLVMHFTASYSAARAALLEAWKFYLDRRNFLINRYCQPLYEAWMDEAVAIGRISAPGYFTDPVLRAAYRRCEWVGDAQGQIDPVKEITAAKARVDLGVSTREREAMAFSGVKWQDLHRQLAREHQMRVDAGLEPPVLNATATEAVVAPAEEQDKQDGTDAEKPEDGK